MYRTWKGLKGLFLIDNILKIQTVQKTKELFTIWDRGEKEGLRQMQKKFRINIKQSFQ